MAQSGKKRAKNKPKAIPITKQRGFETVGLVIMIVGGLAFIGIIVYVVVTANKPITPPAPVTTNSVNTNEGALTNGSDDGTTTNGDVYTNTAVEWLTYSEPSANYTVQYPPGWTATSNLSEIAPAVVFESKTATLGSTAGDFVAIYPRGGYETAAAAPYEQSGPTTLGGQAATRKAASASTSFDNAACYYEFPTPPATGWSSAPKRSNDPGGNRILVPCNETTIVKKVLESLRFTEEEPSEEL